MSVWCAEWLSRSEEPSPGRSAPVAWCTPETPDWSKAWRKKGRGRWRKREMSREDGEEGEPVILNIHLTGRHSSLSSAGHAVRAEHRLKRRRAFNPSNSWREEKSREEGWDQGRGKHFSDRRSWVYQMPHTATVSNLSTRKKVLFYLFNLLVFTLFWGFMIKYMWFLIIYWDAISMKFLQNSTILSKLNYASKLRNDKEVKCL